MVTSPPFVCLIVCFVPVLLFVSVCIVCFLACLEKAACDSITFPLWTVLPPEQRGEFFIRESELGARTLRTGLLAVLGASSY